MTFLLAREVIRNPTDLEGWRDRQIQPDKRDAVKQTDRDKDSGIQSGRDSERYTEKHPERHFQRGTQINIQRWAVRQRDSVSQKERVSYINAKNDGMKDWFPL